MKNIFYPFKGIDKISFGNKREYIQKILGDRYETFLRVEFAENTTDYFKEYGFFVEYDKENLCEAIEFNDGSNLYYNNKNLLNYSYSELRAIYDPISENKEDEEGKGVTYHDLGFGVSRVDNHGDDIETIIVFSRKYWSSYSYLLHPPH